MPEQPIDQSDDAPMERTPSETTPIDQEATMLAAQESAFSSSKVTPPPKKKSGRAIKLLAILLVVGLLAGGGYWYWNRTNSKKAPVASTATPEQSTEPATKTAFEQIDQQLSQYKSDNQTVDGDNDSPYARVAVAFNDQHNFTAVKPKQQQAYKLTDVSQSDQAKADFCASLDAQWQSKVSDAQKIFENSGYTVTETRAYTQYNDCGKLLIASNNDEACSLYYGLGGSAKVLFVSLACSPLSELQDTIAQAKEVYTILTDTGVDIGPGRQLVPEQAEYIKDSQTDGYKIAKIPYMVDTYYYKAAGQKWQVVSESGGLSCATTDKTVRLAFKGEACSNSDDTPGTMN